MIRQLGPPTLFVTFPSAEHQWTPLVNALYELQRKRRKRKHIEMIEDFDIYYIIRKDPVTCSRSYRHRINAIKQLICDDKTFYGKIVDYYFVTEFQNRGSEHDHSLLWIENALVYGKSDNTDIEKFVDNYITCNTDHLDPKLANIHRHYHTKSCKKNKKSKICRYNFKFPQ